ncbi:AAC(3) family N-acetyltransferase [Simkania negevensis]|uniref:Aminoglycoside N(3)-acetyltransferase n=1 Tax=Simkania negevensis TaxID=83561 RepID=A0ABS3AQR6_9BACT|nr:AAC(3) family N-acetyltransferase [Simkania negevensis]
MLRAFNQLGIEEGDILFVHSDLGVFGSAHDLISRDDILSFYYNLLFDLLGGEDKGTLVVPAYYYDYARKGLPFDVETSPVSKSLGALSRHVNARPSRVRSCNPLLSIAAVGSQAEAICGSGSLNGYGVTSPWHRLHEHNAKFLFFGVSMQSMTYVHYIEQQYNVPHLYCKLFDTPVSQKGRLLPGRVVTTVRYLNYGIEYDIIPFQTRLLKKGIAKKTVVKDNPLYLVEAQGAFAEGVKCLDEDIYYFLRQQPAFSTEQPPLT